MGRMASAVEEKIGVWPTTYEYDDIGRSGRHEPRPPRATSRIP